MNITRENIDALNAVVTVDIQKEDYSDKVNKILDDYRRSANIPGFRKGHVPMGMVRKQYGKAVLVDEVNKLIQESLNNYLVEEKLDVLGNPLPKMQEDFNWDAENFSFEFELGLAPEFEVNLKGKKKITHYKIVADNKMLEEQLLNVQKRYGKLISKEEVDQNAEVTGVFKNEEKAIETNATFSLDKLKGKKNQKALIGKKVSETVTFKTKGLLADDHDLMHFLKVSHDEAHGLDIEVDFTISEINERELADLDQELFDKLFGEGQVKNVTELKERFKEDAERQFVVQSDQKLLNDVTEHLIENTKFELPAEFLKKWIKNSGEEPLTDDQVSEEWEKSEKGLRYQLIEGKVLRDHNIEINFEDLKEHAKQVIRGQMAQFGQLNPSDEEVEGIVARVLQNQDEARRLSEQVVSQKLLQLYKEKANLKEKEITYEAFVKEVYG